MNWTIAAIAAAFAALAAAAVVALRRKAARRGRTIGWVADALVAEAGAADGLYALSSQDAAQFERLAREQMHRQQAEWSRDYLPSVTAGTRPGRLSGIPRALRVRR